MWINKIYCDYFDFIYLIVKYSIIFLAIKPIGGFQDFFLHGGKKKLFFLYIFFVYIISLLAFTIYSSSIPTSIFHSHNISHTEEDALNSMASSEHQATLSKSYRRSAKEKRKIVLKIQEFMSNFNIFFACGDHSLLIRDATFLNF